MIYLPAGSTGLWILRFDPLAATHESEIGSDLLSAWPNPFQPSTTLSYSLAQPEVVDLRIIDVSGRLIKTLANSDLQRAGRHEIRWHGRDNANRPVATGVYFSRLVTPSKTETRRITLNR